MQATNEFAVGQRWLSDTEPELGLGIVSDLDHRSVTLEYFSCDELRRYARSQAPLTRILFKAGDVVKDREQQEFLVTGVDLIKGLARYEVEPRTGANRGTENQESTDEPRKLVETELNDKLSLNKPLERLLSGQFEQYQWFYLRQRTLEETNRISQSRVLGLCSGRTELIPHQLYIASEVARRHAPRVMLADEVGLGKTIEAGLILQQQLSSGLASRVLIVVPDPLLHQWLVEMLRRFNLHFSLLDHERCVALRESGEENPFLAEQLVLSGLELFREHPEWYEEALQGEWDLCVVDEAHHLKDSEAGSDYQRMSRIAQATRGMLLLTATPEQMGEENHFALLQLLDRNRFSDYGGFVEEQQQYRRIAGIINALLSGDHQLTRAELQALSETLEHRHSQERITELLSPLTSTSGASAKRQAARERLINILLDQHGTGRVLFRNTRRSLSGFPERRLHDTPLPLPEEYARPANAADDDLASRLSPELLHSDKETSDVLWTSFDPRVTWLLELLKRLPNEKILLICGRDQTAIELEKHLRVREGIRSSVFHRNMNLVERDRAAAYFASGGSEVKEGARILVCSEIGSEGRNFQFCHHLVLFDLPLNPDLLEQRIGRLDRIGQKQPIDIHVPWFQDSAQARLFRWYQALSAFENIAPAAWRIYEEMRPRLLDCLREAPGQPTPEFARAFEKFLEQARDRNSEVNRELESGRDRLIEINSYRPETAREIINQIRDFEASSSPEQYMKEVFDTFGLHYEHNSDGSYHVAPTDEMLLSAFPGLPDGGLNLTFSRELSLHREDIQFLSWQHPMVRGAMDLVMNSARGNAAVSSAIPDPTPLLRGKGLVAEAIFRIAISAPSHLQLQRFLPDTHIHLVVDSDRQELSAALPVNELRDQLEYAEKGMATVLLREHQSTLIAVLENARQRAQQQMAKSVNIAASTMLQSQTDEIKRLVALKKVNPNVRDSELEYLKSQTLQLHQSFRQASVELSAVHIIFRAPNE